jgi:hypothetical protein
MIKLADPINGMQVIELENEFLKISILAGRGSDIFELIYKPASLNLMLRLQKPIYNPREHISQRRDTGNQFEDYYYGGWQEILPNSQPFNYRGAELGQHGEVWLNAWEFEIIKNDSAEAQLKMWNRPLRVPLLIEKILTIKSGDPTLYINETLTNESRTELDIMWGHHIAFGLPWLKSGGIIETNARTFEAEPAMPELRKFAPGQVYNWPDGLDKSGNEVRADLIPDEAATPYSELAYLEGFEGNAFYAITDNERNIKFRLDWESKTFPCLWYWQERYATQDAPWWGSAYAIALEPWSSRWSSEPEKDIEKGNWMKLDPGEKKQTALKANVSLAD